MTFDSTASDADRRPMVGLLAANTISELGNTFSTLAIPWFVLSTTGSASQTGITVAVGIVPFILVGILGGAVVDRIGYKRASIIADLLSGLSVLLIPLLHQTVGLAFWQLLVLVFLGAFFDGPGITARQALFPELAQRANTPLERANTGYALTSRVATVIGQPLAGILIAMFGASNLLWVNAATFGISSLVIRFLVPNTPVTSPAGSSGGFRGYLEEVRGGFLYLFGNQLLLAFLIVLASGRLLVEPLYSVILPVYANEVLGSVAQLGFIFAGLGVGSIIGNLLYAGIGPRLSRSTLLIGGLSIRAVMLSVMILSPPWWIIATAIVIGAIALEPINPMRMSVAQEQVPPGLRGRVFGAQAAISASALPIGVVTYGFLMSGIGLQPTLVVFTVANLALPLVALSVPTLRDIPRPDPTPSVASRVGR